MKIGVNARFLLSPNTGIGQYTYFLFSHLMQMDSENKYILMTQEGVPFENVCVMREKNFGSSSIKKVYWEQIQVPRFLKKEKCDLIHFPYPCNPWYRFKIPHVLTIHDTIPLDFPEYRKRFLSKLYHKETLRAVSRASKIITVSNASKKDILKHFDVPKEKVSVIYNAASPVFSHEMDDDHQRMILRKYGINRPYFLYVGGYDVRKNVKILLEVFDKYIAKHYAVDLILVGEKLYNSPLYSSFDYLTERDRRHTIKPRKGGVKRIGFVPSEELAAIYRNSLCFLHLSAKEGFNIPIVEAAESGTGVIVSDIEVHREIAGDCAEYVEPSDPRSIGDKLRKVIEDPNYRESLAQKALGLRGKYNWQKTAEETLRIYNSLL